MSVKDNYPTIRPSLLLDFANTKTLDPRITFSRASTATFYDDNTVAKAEENLLTYSQEFDNAAWLKGATSVIANATTAPDGTVTADKLVATAVSGNHRIGRNAGSGAAATYSYSFYAKAAEYTKVFVGDPQNYFYSAQFNLAVGSASVISTSNCTATIVDAGNGWYRCTLTYTLASATFLWAIAIGYPDSGATFNGDGANYTGDGTSGIYLWGAQLEQRSTVTAYTPTTTQPITNYIPVLQTAAAGVARFDHNPVTRESLGLLVEEQRTNLLLRSEEFDNAAWGKTAITVVANTVVAPDGTITGEYLQETAAASEHSIIQSVTASSATFTLYVKAGQRNRIGLALPGSASKGNIFDLATLAISNFATVFSSADSASITPVGNGWYRCSITSTTSVIRADVYILNSGNERFYTGDGYSGIYIWGAQLEAGAFPTSYIKTEASQVTRAADSAEMTGSNFTSWYRADEGTFYYEAATNKSAASSPISTVFDVRNLASFPTNYFLSAIHVDQHLRLFYNNTSVVNINSGTLNYNGVFNKIAVALKTDDYAVSSAGRAVVADSSGVLGGDMSRMLIGTNLNGYIRKLAYYPVRLNNTNLVALTQG